MAWIKVPAENHPLFRSALPKGATTKNMFGGVAAFVNDNMFGGLFARSIIVQLSDADRLEALALDGAAPFDPMGSGRLSRKVQMPESVMDEPDEMKRWLQRAYDYVATLPKKKKSAPKKKPAKKKPAKKKPAKKKKR